MDKCKIRTFKNQEYVIKEIAENMRRIDAFELNAIGCADIEDGIRQSIAASVVTMFMTAEDKPICIFGISKEVYEQGRVIWCLGTDDVDKHKKSFVRHSAEILKWWGSQYGRMFNYVSADNKKSIAWLKRMGAKLYYPIPINDNGDLFHLFTIGGDDNV